ncbi:MAG: Ig-like domain repeat protein [Dehalococcoidia bacterium]|nr:Ig-like domain repeat protein [Dehalococcoidia bacterium]
MASFYTHNDWPNRFRRLLVIGLVVLGPAILALLSVVGASAAGRVGVQQAAPNVSLGTASFTIDVTRDGFNGKTDLVIQVEPGQEIEIKFVYGDADLNDPEQKHRIQIEGYDIDVPLDLDHREATVKFVADQAGTFAIRCKSKCKGHRQLQNAMLFVGTGPAPGSAAAPPALVTALTIGSVSRVAGGDDVQLTATLVDPSGQPVAGAPVVFLLKDDFLGIAGEREIGSAQTDAAGAATLIYQPYVDGDLTVLARFDGVGNYAPSEGAATLHVEDSPPAYVPEGHSGLDIPGWGPWWIFMLVGAVWLVYAFVYFQVNQLRQDR